MKAKYFLQVTKFVSLKSLRSILLVLLVLLTFFYLGAFIFQTAELMRFTSSPSSPDHYLSVLNSIGGNLYVNILFWTTIVLYLRWIFVAYRNLYAFGIITTRTPLAILLENITPIVNIWGLYIGINELWRRTTKATSAVLIKFWWFLAMIITGIKAVTILVFNHTLPNFYLNIQAAQQASTIPEWMTNLTWAMLIESCLTFFCSAIFFALTSIIVNKISIAEERLALVPGPKLKLNKSVIIDPHLANQKSCGYIIGIAGIEAIIFLLFMWLYVFPILMD